MRDRGVDDRRAERDAARIAAGLGAEVRAERRRRGLSLRDLAGICGLSSSTVQRIEAGEPGSLEAYARVAVALRLRPEFVLVDPRRRGGPQRQADLVHAAMGEAQAAHFRRLGLEVRLDEPYQHYQFAGRADIAAWPPAPAPALAAAPALAPALAPAPAPAHALLHIENRTEFHDLQAELGAYNAKRAYLGQELAARAGIDRWDSETHVIAALWSADVLRAIRRHRASFESICPDGLDAFEQWWRGGPTSLGRRSIFVLFDPVEGKRSDRRRWVGLAELDGLRPRYRDYADAAARIVAP